MELDPKRDYGYPVKVSAAIACGLIGLLLGLVMAMIAFIVYQEKRTEIFFYGPSGTVQISADGVRMRGQDYSEATLLFGGGPNGPTPVLQITDPGGAVQFRSVPGWSYVPPAAKAADSNRPTT